MANKVQKIREEVEKLKSQLLRGACSSQVAMETRCKEEAYNEVLTILDTMQEEPMVIDCARKQPLSYGKEELVNNGLDLGCGVIWRDKEPVSEELKKAAVEAFKQIVDSDKNNFLEIFKAGSQWRKQQMINKGAELLRKSLDNGMWVDQFLSEKDKKAIILTFKENMEEEWEL